MKCSIPICDRQAKARGMCSGHYDRCRNGVPLDSPIREKLPCKDMPCRVVGCFNDSWAKRLCRFHDSRRRQGIPDEFLDMPVHYKSLCAKGWIHKGYRWVMDSNGREVLEHRKFMEEHLGRKLGYDEVVHHINGDKLDNRLNNLEVIDRAEHQAMHRREQLYNAY